MVACCKGHGPGYATPLDAFNSGAREKLLYVPAIIADASRPDYLATVDVDPTSATYATVIHRLPMPHNGDELHHTGWNACSSCYDDPSKSRSLLILPAVKSGRIYAVDVTAPTAPKLHKTVEAEAVHGKTALAYPHTSHCLADGNIMVSTMGDAKGGGKGNFVLLDGSDLSVKGKWTETDTALGYDFWYQPRLNIMISSEFGKPSAFFEGFDPSLVPTHYGSKLYVWNWREKTLRQEIDLGADGLIPLETRFLHDPSSPHGYVGAALSSNVIAFEVDAASGKVATHVAIRQEWLPVQGWALPSLPPLITDILISLNDKYLIFSNWLRGDVNLYDISDPKAPKLADRVWLGGSIAAGSGVTVAREDLEGLGLTEQPARPVVKGVTVQGGPQMLQLSLDGKRLYVTNSLLSAWDKQFYSGMVEKGSQLVLVDVDQEAGKLTLNPDFVVDFGAEPGGPALAHECRYPGGDCSSDIWL